MKQPRTKLAFTIHVDGEYRQEVDTREIARRVARLTQKLNPGSRVTIRRVTWLRMDRYPADVRLGPVCLN